MSTDTDEPLLSPTSPQTEPELISIKAATAPPYPFGKFSVPTIYKLIREGRVKAYKVGAKTMIDVASFREGLRAQPLVLPVKVAEPTQRKRVKAARPAREARGRKGKTGAGRPRRDAERRPGA